jgi:hypothetical protein
MFITLTCPSYGQLGLGLGQSIDREAADQHERPARRQLADPADQFAASPGSGTSSRRTVAAVRPDPAAVRAAATISPRSAADSVTVHSPTSAKSAGRHTDGDATVPDAGAPGPMSAPRCQVPGLTDNLPGRLYGQPRTAC